MMIFFKFILLQLIILQVLQNLANLVQMQNEVQYIILLVHLFNIKKIHIWFIIYNMVL